MKTLHKLILGLGLVLPMLAAAQWQWLDKDGRKVFSDRPPPAEVPAKNILKQPSAPKAAAATAEPAPAADPVAGGTAAKVPAGNIPKLSGKDQELEEKKKKAEAEAEAKRVAETEKNLKARSESCKRALQAKATLESGVRIARTGASGQREIMDDPARAAELKRIQDIVTKDCAL